MYEYLKGYYTEYKDTASKEIVKNFNIVSDWKAGIVVVMDTENTVLSAYKEDENNEYLYLNSISKQIKEMIKIGANGYKSVKNQEISAIPSEDGIITQHTYVKAKKQYDIYEMRDKLCGIEINSDIIHMDLSGYKSEKKLPEFEYTILSKHRVDEFFKAEEEERPYIKTVAEVGLEKDLSWLKEKKYYVVNDEATVEKLIQAMEAYNGPIVVDLETTGLKMNCFGKVGSKYAKRLEEYNKTHENKIKSDHIVGYVFSWKPNVSYYIPVGHRYYKNVYDDRGCQTTKDTIKYVRDSIEKLADNPTKQDIVNYVRSKKDDELTSDVLLACRLRNLLETHYMVAHNGSFEWKSLHCYDIVLNLKEDTMLLHQVLYKFRSTTSNKGESSSLKDITHREFGADTCELTDFFPGFKEGGAEVVQKSSKKDTSYIDFSYMSLEGTKVYAPADGDFTLQILLKYKKDLIENNKHLEYLYNVEVMVAGLIGYMEFYGHRIDENKIEETRQKITKENEDRVAKIKELAGIKNDEDFNLASPMQVADLFFNRMKIPFTGDKISVSKSVMKQYTQAKNPDGSDKYPVIVLYNEWKKMDTLLTKFFDNLQYYMYPGGYIFSHFGQIATATGRMSCSKPNCQQYPHAITDIVIPHEDCIMIDADYSQIEYRVLVGMSKEENLLHKFADPDVDYHTLMASLMYNVPYELVTSDMRKAAKSFNFGIPYGMGFGSLSVLLTGDRKLEHINYAKEKYEDYFREQPKVRQFFGDVKEAAEMNGYTSTYFGRRRYYSFKNKDGTVSSEKRARALRQAGNALIQGCLGGETRIQTKEKGIVKIQDVVSEHLHVWDGKEWTEGDIMYSGYKQKCVVTFEGGQKFVCSPIHKFLVNKEGKEEFIECKELNIKDRVVINKKYELSDYKGRNRHTELCDEMFKDTREIASYLGNKRIECSDGKLELTDNYEDMQKAYLFMGQKTEYVNNNGKTELKFTEHEIGGTIGIKSIEITEEKIEMYDVCNTERGYYVADGIITHNTAADVFKIAMARMYSWIKSNNLFGKYFLMNMIHDEQLSCFNVKELNYKKVIADVTTNMQFQLKGFPPFFVGAGLGDAWGTAKGKPTEIHPHLRDEIVEETKNETLLWNRPDIEPVDVYKAMNKTIYEFRKNTIIRYLEDENNFHKVIKPAVGNLMQTFFCKNNETPEEIEAIKARINEINEYYEAHTGKLLNAKKDFDRILIVNHILKKNLPLDVSNIENIQLGLIDKFADDFKIPEIDYRNFTLAEDSAKKEEDEQVEETDEDEKEYEDVEDVDGEEDGSDEDIDESAFEIINEDSAIYGASIEDLIDTFKVIIFEEKKIFGIDMNSAGSAIKSPKFLGYLQGKICNADEPGAMEFVLLKSDKEINHSGIFVKGVKYKDIEKYLGIRV